MKSFRLLFIAGILSLPLAFTNCKKSGCTDENAANFVFKANEDDGSCLYQGNILFWYDYQTAVNIDTAGVDSLYFYVDSVLQHKVSVLESYSPITADCDNPNSIVVERSLGSKSSESALWHINDPATGTTWYNGEINFVGGQCTQEHIEYPE